MAALRTHAAAARLGIAPSTLRTWERRYGFPVPERTAGGHRDYSLRDVRLLQEALAETGHAAAAVALARDRAGGGPARGVPEVQALRDALTAFDEDAADRVLAEVVALRGVEAALADALLPGVAALPAASAEAAVGVRWALGWLAAQRRLAPPASRPEGVLLLDAGTPDAHLAALELVLRRVGLRVLALPLQLAPERLERAVAALAPAVAVLGGPAGTPDRLGRAVFACRRAARDPLELRAFRPALGPPSTVPALPAGLLGARDAILALATAPRPALRSVAF